jgi:hypothetical protein
VQRADVGAQYREADIGLHLHDAVPVARVGLLAVRGGPRLLLVEELTGP